MFEAGVVEGESNGGGISAARRASGVDSRMADESLRQRRREISYEVTRAYYQVLLAERRAEVATKSIERGTEAAWKHAYSVANVARRLRATAAPLRVALATNLAYRFYAYRLHRFYTCDWMIDPAPPAMAPAVPRQAR